jgi:hypothetical protein
MKDMTGRTFGHWTVTGDADWRRDSRYLHCSCACGTAKEVAYTTLLAGRSASCGCGLVYLNLTGQKFHKLTVVQEADHRAAGRYWLCRCECGNTAVIKQTALRRGATKSCGCLKAEMLTARNTTHGLSRTREYNIWQRMKARCNDPGNKDYDRYGGRCFKVCERWMDSFENFYADMGPKPRGRSLDRYPNNDGDYEPGNVRWATQSQQCRNKANNRLLTHSGVTLCVADWADRLGVKFSVLNDRINRYGWSIERALS